MTPGGGSAHGRNGALFDGTVRRRCVRRARAADHRSRTKSPRETPLFSRHRGWPARTSSTGTVVPFRAHRRPVLVDVVRRSDDDAPHGGASPSRTALLKEEDLRAIEGTYPDGITAVQIVDALTSGGITYSQASVLKD